MSYSMNSKPKVCIFCGATPLSKEHIWSEWTYRILPKVKGGLHIRGVVQTSSGSPKIKGIRKIKRYQGQVNTIQVKAVCASKKSGTNNLGKVGCNNGWMNAQEEAVKPILTPLILEQSILMDQSKQAILASWFVTKIMVAEFENPEDLVSTQEERDFVFKNRCPPPDWKVWIGCQTGNKWRTGYGRHTSTLELLENGRPVFPNIPPIKNTQLVTMGIGRVFIHAFYSRSSALKIDYPNKVALFRIYPFDSDFVWPPLTIVRDADIDFLHAAFDRHLSGLRWRRSSV
jgi:hypothetical protein